MRTFYVSLLARVAALFVPVFVAGCGHAHVKNVRVADDLSAYRRVLIESVTVTSVEQNAHTQADNDQLAAYAREQAIAALRGDGRYQVLEPADAVDEGTLKLRIDSNVRYGNRALRYMVGFGAGSGRVVSTLTGTVAPGDEEKLRSVSESDLAVGMFGGNMKAVFRKNILALLRNGSLLEQGKDR